MRGQLVFGISDADIFISLEQGVHHFGTEIGISAEGEPLDGRAGQSWFLVLQGQIELNFIHNEGGLGHMQTNILSSAPANLQMSKTSSLATNMRTVWMDGQ